MTLSIGICSNCNRAGDVYDDTNICPNCTQIRKNAEKLELLIAQAQEMSDGITNLINRMDGVEKLLTKIKKELGVINDG